MAVQHFRIMEEYAIGPVVLDGLWTTEFFLTTQWPNVTGQGTRSKWDCMLEKTCL